MERVVPTEADAAKCNDRECRHRKWTTTTHCAEMSRSNYVNKCKEHSFP